MVKWIHSDYNFDLLTSSPMGQAHYVLGDQNNYIKNVDLKSSPRWSKVQGGGDLGSFGKVPKLVHFFFGAPSLTIA